MSQERSAGRESCVAWSVNLAPHFDPVRPEFPAENSLGHDESSDSLPEVNSSASPIDGEPGASTGSGVYEKRMLVENPTEEVVSAGDSAEADNRPEERKRRDLGPPYSVVRREGDCGHPVPEEV